LDVGCGVDLLVEDGTEETAREELELLDIVDTNDVVDVDRTVPVVVVAAEVPETDRKLEPGRAKGIEGLTGGFLLVPPDGTLSVVERAPLEDLVGRPSG
jgi:hypothetical protein